MIRPFFILTTGLVLTACSYGAPYSAPPSYQPFPGQGQYVRPDHLAAQPTPMIPPVDTCRSKLYAGLVGQHEGAIFVPGLPGHKRVLKPAFPEGFGYSPGDPLYNDPPLVQVREFLPQQSLYAPSINTVTDRINLGPDNENRLTIELDAEGYVQAVECS